MADGSIEFSVELDSKDAEKELANLAKKIRKLELDLSVKGKQKTALEAELERAGIAADQAKAKLAALAAERDRLKALTPADGAEYLSAGSRLSALAEEIKEQQAIVNGTEKEFNKAADAVDKCNREIETLNNNLDATKDLYGQTAQEAAKLPEETGKAAEAMEAAKKKVEQFRDRVKSIVGGLFVFSLINRALSALRSYLGEVIQKNAAAQAAIAKLRGALLTLAQPLVNVIIPAFTKLVEVLARVAATAARIVSKLFGTTVETSAAQAEAAYGASDGLEAESAALRDTAQAAKEAEKQLASFDEVQKLTSDTAEDNADLSNDGGAGLDTTGGTEPDFTSVIQDRLDAIVELFAGAALLALGAILTFSGANIPLGIALMVIGALAIWDAISEDKEAIVRWIQEHSDAIALVLVGIASVALIAGIILLLTGHILIGIGLIILGIALFAAAAALNGDAIVQFIEEHSDTIAIALLALAAVAVLVGIVLLLAGQVLVGIGLIILGIAMYAAAASLDNEAIQKFVEENSSTIAVALLALGAVAVLVGIVLLIVGQVLIGIGLILLGIALFVTAAVLDSEAIQKFIEENSDTIAVALLALAAVAVVVGIVLLFTPSFLLGIGLILLGIAMFVAAAEISTEIQQWIQDNMQTITTVLLVAAAVAVVVGIVLLFTPAFLIGIGLILVGIALFAAAVEINDELSKWIEDNMGKIAAVVTVLGAAMLVIGIVLLFTGVGIPIGIGLIVAGLAAMSIGTAMEPDWDWLGNKLQEIWDSIANAAKAAWEAIRDFFIEIWDKIKETVSKKAEEIKQKLDETWKNIKDKAKEQWDKIKETIFGIIDGIKEKINGLFDKAKEIAGKVKDTLSGIGSKIGGFLGIGGNSGTSTMSIAASGASMPRIPLTDIPGLARGAVIPPNREFLAVLGDQRSGNNIEAPESALQAMADRAAGANTELLREILQAIKAGKVIEVDKQQFGQVVNDAYTTESARVGARFVQVT